MKNLFFYGTLAYRPLLEIVLGRGLADGQTLAASLPKFASHWVADQAYPMLAPQTGDGAATGTKGLLLLDPTPTDIERLNFYEGGFEYTLRDVTVKTQHGAHLAQVYFPDHPLAKGPDWDLTGWVNQWGALTLHAAEEAMGYFGQISAQQLAARFGAIRLRAASYIRGQGQAGPQAVQGRGDVTVINKRMPYSNFYAVQEYDLRHRQFDGTTSPQMERGVFVTYDAAIVLPYDPLRDCVLLVEQFRIGVYARGAEKPWVLEPVAGHVDLNETPEQAAIRETMEEAGVPLSALIPITNAYASPGDSTEFFHIYLGLCDLGTAGGTTSGLVEEGEDIHSHILSFDELMEFVCGGCEAAGGANILPLVTAVYWLAINRDRLRKGA